MNTKKEGKTLKVQEYPSFNEAFENAATTKEEWQQFQMETKKAVIRRYGKRFFVDENGELWYTAEDEKGMRLLHKAKITSILSGYQEFEYVMIDTYDSFVRLVFTGNVYGRERATIMSKQAQSVSFYQE